MAVYGPYCSTWVADDNIRTSHQITINKQKREVLIGFKSAQEEEKARNIIKINYFSKEQYMKRWDESVAEQVTQSQEYLLELNTFIHFSNFLLGKNIDIRRWNLGQAKEFSITHETISTLALAAIENKKSK
ncbi:unnamed protein product [Rotaria socialis]|uniref:Uncharacterized protein n=1 Tax=Rotaria socialis TaxID=392032 RepID=A0A818CLG1_9BILA|nr:unnamed protein product [Rotaria socialis]